MWEGVYESYFNLPKEEKEKFIKAIERDRAAMKSDIAKLISNIRETRFSEGIGCVHCGSIEVVRHGKYRDRQRYKCKDCLKTFNDMTNTPMGGTHNPHLWLNYIEMMIEGYTLPKIAKRLKIHISTAFYWRHKVLNAVRSLGESVLQGVIESDETYLIESMKGSRNITHRESRKRGGVAPERGISKSQVSILVAMDRNGNIISRKNGFGRTTAYEIESVLGDFVEPTSILCTDTATNYKKFAKMRKLPHETINASKGIYVKKHIYHIQHVNSYHKQLKQWLDRFQGVSTKWLDNYLYWFRFLQLQKKLPYEEQITSLLLGCCRNSNYSTVEELRAA